MRSKLYKFKIKNKLRFVSVLLIMLGIYSISIGYSSFFTTLSIKNNLSYVRLNRNMRVTALDVEPTNPSVAKDLYHEYNEHTLAYGIRLANNNSSITYKVQVINFGNEEKGILKFTGLPSELKYTVTGYDLKTKMCDAVRCANGMKKEFYITFSYADTSIVRSSKDFYFNLEVIFKNMRIVIFEANGGGVTPTSKEVMEGDVYGTLPTPTNTILFRFDGWFTAPTGGSKVLDTTVVTTPNDHYIYARWTQICPYYPGTVWTFDYNGGIQTFSTPCNGQYKLEVWGAQGGNDGSAGTGGYGGYATGKKTFTKNSPIYVVVGGQGASSASGAGGGYNGGGNAGSSGSSGGGGGATHMASTSGVLSSLSGSTGNVFIVAGGGGGGGNTAPTVGGAGGGTSGLASSGGGGTQTAGGAGVNAGGFGYGGSRGTTISYTTTTGSTAYSDRAGVTAHTFTAPITGTVNFYSTSHTSDPWGYVYVNGTQQCSNDDGNGNLDFKCSVAVNAGDSVELRTGAFSSAGSCDWTVTYPSSSNSDGGGGGAGWYGGGAAYGDNGGGGGSGYVGSLTDTSLASGIRSGSGFAQITLMYFTD